MVVGEQSSNEFALISSELLISLPGNLDSLVASLVEQSAEATIWLLVLVVAV